MDGKVFADTNFLLYAHDSQAPRKRAIALALYKELVSSDRLVVSTQILGELFYNAIRPKGRRPALTDRATARQILRRLAEGDCYTNTPADYVRASAVSEENRISFWDALVVVAASQSGAERILTEDMNDGQTIEGVRLENPFATKR